MTNFLSVFAEKQNWGIVASKGGVWGIWECEGRVSLKLFI